MTEVFLKIVNMSLSAGWLVLAVLVLRFVLKKAPKWVNVLLWGIVAARLLCPISIESALSLIPSAEVISPEIMMGRTPEITTGIPAVNSAVNPIIAEHFTPAISDSANPLQIWIAVAAQLWFLGVLVMAGYTAVSYLRLRRRVAAAMRLHGNIFRSSRIPSPFVLGIVKPRIYLPAGMAEADVAHVIAHEQTHIRRRDHWWKPLGFLLLTIHWFNPLMWAAYILLCRDIELACDEKVIQELGREQRADYSQALLSCSVNRKSIAACPLAFGEVGVKERVKNVLSYKKPAFWVIVLALILCGIVAVCFLTDPNPSREFSMDGNNVADLDPRKITDTIVKIEGLKNDSDLRVNANNFDLRLTSDFAWADSQAIRFFYDQDQQTYSAQLRIFPEDEQFFVTESTAWPEQNRIYMLYHYLWAVKTLPQEAIRAMCPDADGYILRQIEEGTPDSYDRVITYSHDGMAEIDSWLIHLELQPLHDNGEAQSGTGEEVIHLFYGSASEITADGVYEWANIDRQEIYEGRIYKELVHPNLPGVIFRYDACEITAEEEKGETVLIQGMPISNVYLADLTGDGYPEICATVCFGSGLVDRHVVVYDYANRQEYTLWDRGYYDYDLMLEDGKLFCEQRRYRDGELLAAGELILADAGKRLTIAGYDGNPGSTVGLVWISGIVDRTVTEQLDTAEAEEVFFEDEAYEYSFGSIRSHYVMVTYSDGSSEDIKTALAAGRASIKDLDTFGIQYFVKPKQTVIQPTGADLRGIHAEHLFVSMGGATYRYTLTEPIPENVTTDILLDTFTEDVQTWKVYALKEYPDLTKVLLVSGTVSAWLCEYAPDM